VFEIQQRISAPPLTVCEQCGGAVRRLLSPAPFILKGGGWYVTDYPSEARKKAVEAEKSPEKKPSGEQSSTSTSSPATSTSQSNSSAAPAAPSTGSSASASKPD
jgi:putative FmdB family regulatory protein